TDFFNSADNAFSDHVAAYDATKDVDEYGFNIVVRQNNFERFNYTFFGRTTAHIEEVGRLATVQLNNVHSTHSQTGTINHAADVAIQCYIVKLPGGCVRFACIFLSRILHFFQFRMTIQGVTIDNQFCVQAVQVPFWGNYQRVNFQQCQIFFFEQPSQVQEDIYKLVNLLTFETQFECQPTPLEWLSANQWVDSGFEDFLRGFVRNFLDLHTTFSRCHAYATTAGTIHYCAQIYSFGAVSAGFHQNAANGLAFFVSLVSHQVFAQPLFSEGFDFFFALNELHTARLTTATGMNLSLNYKHITTDLIGSFHRFSNCCCSDAFGCKQTILGKELFTLILVQIHGVIPF